MVTINGSAPLTAAAHVQGMSDLSFMLSRALAKGRGERSRPVSRAEILAALLRKRAEAHRHGLAEQEEKLREQIRWALPIHPGAEPAPPQPPADLDAADWTQGAQS
jgi:hypothetical protein